MARISGDPQVITLQLTWPEGVGAAWVIKKGFRGRGSGGRWGAGKFWKALESGLSPTVSCFPKADCRGGSWRAGVRRLYADGRRLMGIARRNVAVGEHSKATRTSGFGSLRAVAPEAARTWWLGRPNFGLGFLAAGKSLMTLYVTLDRQIADVGTRQDPSW